ncbi:MAG: hypothetical protein JNM93_04345 [Bacteriovoracaceae bacterium]|nr:hypothetical protein [Bacteriovoracaceae bacterium]
MMKLFLVILLFFGYAFAQDEADELINEKQAAQNRLIEAQKKINEVNPNDEYDVVIEEPVPTDSKYIGLPQNKAEAAESGGLSDLKTKYLPELKYNPLAGKTIDEVKAHILSRVEGSNWETFFRSYPKMLDFIAELLSHEDAFMRLASIINKSDKLTRYFYCFLVVFIVAIYWNYKMPKTANFFVRFTRRLVFYIGSLTLNVSSFYVIFRYELDPTIEIFVRNFL